MVIHLIADLIRKKKVRTAFNLDPDGVMNDYGLSTAQKCVVYSMNPDTIAEAVGKEIKNINVNFMDGEFPPMDENCLPEPTGGQPSYPVPTPDIFRLRPRTVSKADHPGGVFELNVHGQSFSRPSLVDVRNPGDGTSLNISGQYVLGTYRCSHARAVVTLPNNPGNYDVYVVLCPGQAGEIELTAPYQLEITA